MHLKLFRILVSHILPSLYHSEVHLHHQAEALDEEVLQDLLHQGMVHRHLMHLIIMVHQVSMVLGEDGSQDTSGSDRVKRWFPGIVITLDIS